MRLILIAATLALVVLSSAAIAQPAKAGFPFGLDHLHWQMIPKEVSDQFYGIAPQTKAPGGSPLTNQSANYFGPYPWHDCVFTMSLYFTADDHLDRIDVEGRGLSQACQSAIQAELTSHYGNGTQGGSLPPNIKHTKWTSADTDAVYNSIDNAGVVEIGLSAHDSPPLIIADPVRGAP